MSEDTKSVPLTPGKAQEVLDAGQTPLEIAGATDVEGAWPVKPPDDGLTDEQRAAKQTAEQARLDAIAVDAQVDVPTCDALGSCPKGTAETVAAGRFPCSLCSKLARPDKSQTGQAGIAAGLKTS